MFYSFDELPIPRLDYLKNSEIGAEVRKRFEGKHWRDVTLEDWINVASVNVIAGVLKLEHFLFYAPSISVGSIDSPDYVDWGVLAWLPKNSGFKVNSASWVDFLAKFGQQNLLDVIDYFNKVKSSNDNEIYGSSRIDLDVMLRIGINLYEDRWLEISLED